MKWTFRHTSVAAFASWWLISCIKKLNSTVETWASELGQGGLTLFPSLYQRNTRRHQGAPWEEDNPVKALPCCGPCPAGEPCRPSTPVSWNHAPWGPGPLSAEKGTEQQMLSDGLRRRTTRFRCWLGLQIPQDSIQTGEILSELLRILGTAVSFPGRNDLDVCLRDVSPITVAQHRRLTDDIRGCCSESAQSKSVIWNVHLAPVSL